MMPFISVLLVAILAQGAELFIRVIEGRDTPVPYALVSAEDAAGRTMQVRTGADGRCAVGVSGFPVRLQVLAPGFAVFSQNLVPPGQSEVLVQLLRHATSDSVTVTAEGAETPLSQSTQAVISVSSQDLERNAAITLDDQLRKIPGFSLFRRSGSLVAHPTAQGVSLRGAGPSGASRTLVLADGVPLNDPFGGWVYWGRIPRLSVDRIEIVRGGASELYGTDALGGVIQVFRKRPRSSTLMAEGYYGGFGTVDYAVYGSHRLGRQGVSLAADLFRTDGYNQVAPAERGPVDIEARSRHQAYEATWDFRLRNGGRIFASLAHFTERRGNGTPLQVNDTQMSAASAGAAFVTQAKNEWALLGFFQDESFDAAFSAVALDRTSETLTRLQHVPARGAGAQALWRRALGPRHLLLAGSDYSAVRGASREVPYAAGRPGAQTEAGGRQDRVGVYLQELFRASDRLQIVAGARRDAWRNGGIWRGAEWSPKVGARLQLGSGLAVRSSVSRSFRAPTLNELYRSFRVGNIVTAANPGLLPETAVSSEIGVDWSPAAPLVLRGTLFTSQIKGNIANVTLSSTPALITRQRQNLGATRSRGLELDAAVRLGADWLVSAGYFLSDATVRSAPAVSELVGLRVPQVPTHQAVLQLEFARRGYFVSAALRLTSRQYDDDQNRLVLGGYGVVDLSAGKSLTRRTQLFAACENLSDETYPVGRTPVQTVGMPRRFHAGLRFRFE